LSLVEKRGHAGSAGFRLTHPPKETAGPAHARMCSDGQRAEIQGPQRRGAPFLLTGGQVACCTAGEFLTTMPACDIMHGDKGYDSNALRRQRTAGPLIEVAGYRQPKSRLAKAESLALSRAKGASAHGFPSILKYDQSKRARPSLASFRGSHRGAS
jgi:hypothetical protein